MPMIPVIDGRPALDASKLELPKDRTASRIHMVEGKLTGPHGGVLLIRPNREGFWIGCTFIKWDAWDEIKRQVATYE